MFQCVSSNFLLKKAILIENRNTVLYICGHFLDTVGSGEVSGLPWDLDRRQGTRGEERPEWQMCSIL